MMPPTWKTARRMLPRKKYIWLLFDISNGGDRKHYVWWFRTRREAREHKAHMQTYPHMAAVVGPVRAHLTSRNQVKT